MEIGKKFNMFKILCLKTRRFYEKTFNRVKIGEKLKMLFRKLKIFSIFINLKKKPWVYKKN